MTRKLVGGLSVLVVVLGGVWWLWLRDRGDSTAAKPGAGSARSAEIAAKPAATPAAEDPKAQSPRAIMRWSLDVDPEGPLQLEGQVIGPDGKGVAGAKVWLASVPPRSITSEDDGTFSFDKLVGRTYSLTATSGDMVGGPVRFKLTDRSDPVVIRLTEGAAIKVAVVDDAKRAIAGAEVQIDDDERDDARSARTDERGEATLKPIRPGWLAVEASAAGYAPNSAFTTVGSAGATGRVTIILRKGFAVSGRVVDEAGKPIAKAKVTVASTWGFGDGGDRDPVTSDNAGKFTLPAVAAGTHTLAAVDGEHAPARSAPFTISDRAATGIDITMKAGGTLAGVVVDGDGKPVSYATVRVAGASQQVWETTARQTTSDRKGEFELRGLARTKLRARAESDAAASKLVDVDLTPAAAKRDLKLVLDVAGMITGIVVDEKDAPVAEVQVNALPDFMGGASFDGLALAGMSSTTSAGDGTFTVHGLPDGPYRLWASRSGNQGGQWGQQGTPAKPGDRNVRIRLPAPGSLIGKVVLEGSTAPPKLVSVQIGYEPSTPASDGVFAIKDVTPGKYNVKFRGPEFAELTRHDVTIEAGKPTDLGTITVVRGRKLVGRVVDSAGRGVASAKVKLGERLFSLEGNEDQLEMFEEMGGIRTAISDQDGGFSIVGVPKVATSAMADHPAGGRSLAVAIPEGIADPPPLTLTLRGFGSISGKVTQKGVPLGGVTVGESAKGGAAQAAFTRTDDAGMFRLAKVTEGTHVVQAMQQKAMSMKSTTVTVQVTAGKDTKVDIDIPVGQITLKVEIKALPGNKVDWSQTFVFTGTVAPANGKQLLDSFLQGGAQGMKIWMGEGKPMPEFEELTAGDYSVCTVPITGGRFDDLQFQQRVQENAQLLKVYCRQLKITASPLVQTFVHEVPAMTPFPAPGQ